MEYPFDHHSHTHHNRRDDDYAEEEQRDRFDRPPPGTHLPSSYDNPLPPYPPPPYYGQDDQPPQPPSYYRHDEPPPPPGPHSDDSYYSSIPPHRPSADYYNYPSEPPPPPQRPHASAYPPSESTAYENQHVSHQSHVEVEESETHHNYRPHLPSFLHHHTDQPASEFSNKPTFKVITKANPNFALAIQDGRVLLYPSDQADDTQHWYKDEKYSTRVKDSEGFPCFALVNKATGQALKHSVGASHPVQLIPYNSGSLDESILWTQSKDMGDGYRTMRMVNNIRLNVDAFHGDKKSGGVHKGTTVVLWDWNKGENQLWKIIPYGA